MTDKQLVSILAVIFFAGSMVALRTSSNVAFIFASTLANQSFGAVLALVRADHQAIDPALSINPDRITS